MILTGLQFFFIFVFWGPPDMICFYLLQSAEVVDRRDDAVAVEPEPVRAQVQGKERRRRATSQILGKLMIQLLSHGHTQVGVIGQKNSHIQAAGRPLHALATHVADGELLQDLRLLHLLL